MSRIKKALVSIIMMVILTSIFSTISNAKDWKKNPEGKEFNAENIKIGDTMSLTSGWASAHKDLFCVVKTQQFGSEKKYKAVSKIAIEGLNATNTHGKTIKSKYNGYLAWILNHSDGKGGFGNGKDKAQRWTWNFIGTWMKKVGYNFDVKNKYEGIWVGFTNKAGFNATWEKEWDYTSWKTGAKAYVESLNKLKVLKDKTGKNIKVERYGNDNLKIGPFTFEFGGELDEFVLYDQNGKAIKNVTFAVKKGGKDKIVKLNKIKSGKKFYAIIPINSGVSSINKVKVTNKYDYIYAKVVFWRYTGNSEKNVNYQNVIQFVTDKKPETVTKEWNEDIPLLINISGKVWEDMPAGKNSEYDDVFHNTNYKVGNDTYEGKDELLNGIKVFLKDLKNKDGKPIKETTTGENGEYKFTDIEISNLKNYYVEFEYNGLTYTSVKPQAVADETITSKAAEIVGKRKSLNDGFTVIKNNDNNTDRNHGKAVGEPTRSITYKNESHKSTLESITPDTNLTANINRNNDIGYDGYSLYDQFTKGNYSNGEIKNVNLGLRRREQPNIAIRNDLKEVKVLVNGYGTTYSKDYGTRGTFIEKNENSGEYETNINAKFESKYGKYYRQIYPSDIQFSSTLKEENDAKKLKVYATYEITVSNISNSLKVSVPEIANYYDSRYSIVADGTVFPQGNLNGVELKKINDEDHSEILSYNKGTAVTDYNTAYISTEEKINEQTKKPRIIEAGKTLVINVTYKVDDETVRNILSKGDQELNTVSEINSYTSYYSRDIEGCTAGSVYAGIDKNSAPGNVILGENSTYESDTDRAPSFILTAKGVRQIEGTVFEDATNPELQSGKVRNGDGKLDDKENKVSGVTVRLLTADGNVATYYPEAVSDDGEIANEDVMGKDGSTDGYITAENGYYIFKGIEPDNYLIQFTYTNGETKIVVPGGDNKDVTVQNYKSTIIKSENIKNAINSETVVDWYKDSYVKEKYPSELDIRYSDAIDDYKIREDIDKDLINLNASPELKINSLNAKTPKIFIPVDLDSIVTESDNNTFVHKISNIDFGIAERPRQSATLEKEISNIKVTLANGQVLVDGDPRGGNLNYVTVTDETIYVTMDSELMQGAHVELKYALTLINTSELDYNNMNYYYYGSDTSNPVKITGATLIDYVDSEMVLKAGQDDKWQVLDLATNGLKLSLSDDEKETLLKQYSTIVEAEAIPKDIELSPVENGKQPEEGKSKITTDIIVEKLLSTRNGELSFENNGETVKINKTGGSMLTTKLGSLAPRLASDVTAKPDELDEDKAPTLSIVPPFGSTNNTVLYAIIGVTSLIVLGAGTYGVRRFLKK